MINRHTLKNIWLVLGIVSIILLAFHWFGYDSKGLQNTLIVLDGLLFILSLPCSLFVVPVVIASNYYMAMSPISGSGLYLNTILLFVIGLTQWFWIVRFWTGTGYQLQRLEVYEEK